MVDDDLELGGVFAASLLVLLVVVDVDLISPGGCFSFLPEDVLNGLAGFSTHVRIDVQFTTASGLLVAAVDAFSRGAKHVEVKIIVIVPHQRNLDVGGLRSLALQTSTKFRHGTLGGIT